MIRLFFLGALSLATVASAQPFDEVLTTWASKAGYVLGPGAPCSGPEETSFGSQRSTCWKAKSRTPMKGSEDTFARVVIVRSEYASERDATARAARFRESPGAKAEIGKVWPLRSSFRVGSATVAVTTDALIFVPQVEAIAEELVTAAHGTELTHWLPRKR